MLGDEGVNARMLMLIAWYLEERPAPVDRVGRVGLGLGVASAAEVEAEGALGALGLGERTRASDSPIAVA